MEPSEIEKLTARAASMLPPATVMLIECAGDSTGDPGLIALLDEVQQKGLQGQPLFEGPYETVVFEDRVLLLGGEGEREAQLPRMAGVGYGLNEEQARRNALYALTLPADHPNTQLPDCMIAQQYGEGPVRQVVYTSILTRAAYRSPEALHI